MLRPSCSARLTRFIGVARPCRAYRLARAPLAVLLLAAASSSPAGAQGTTAGASVSVPVTAIRYVDTGVTDGRTGELRAGPAYGDLGRGAHGTFIRMPAGFVSPVHRHTGDYWGVVVSGVAANGLPGGADVPLPAGSYWFQKGGEAHVTKCLSPNECLFFIGQNARFDYLTAR